MATLVAAVALVGCTPPKPHPWQFDGDYRTVASRIETWPYVPSAQICALTYRADVSLESSRRSFDEWQARNAKASAALASADALPIDREQLTYYCPRPTVPDDPTLRPYLVRGVAQGYPMRTLVRGEPGSNQLVVCTIAYNGEMAFPDPDFSASPVVVFLSERPRRVYVSSVLGGDWVLGNEGEAKCGHRNDATRRARV